MSDKAYCVRVTKPEQFRRLMRYVELMGEVAFYNGAVRLTVDNLLPTGSVLILLTADRSDLRESLYVEGEVAIEGGDAPRPDDIGEEDIHRLEEFRLTRPGVVDGDQQGRCMVVDGAEQIGLEAETEEEHRDIVEKAIAESLKAYSH